MKYSMITYNVAMYQQYSLFPYWAKLKQASLFFEPSIIQTVSLKNLTINELSLYKDSISKFNFVIYETDSSFNFEQCVEPLSRVTGLQTLDKHLCVSEDEITKIADNSNPSKSFYIPYTNKPINWHTDGYYNSALQKVYAFILHCAQPAYEGGVNDLMDQDQVFIHLMQTNPLYVQALMKDDVMTIPENRKEGVLLRPATSTAIFKVINDQHDVLMRYSMRKKNILFTDDSITQEALACMDEFINSESSPHNSIKLKAGQGVISNNVLHKRTAFKDKVGLERLYYRARYYNRINITS